MEPETQHPTEPRPLEQGHEDLAASNAAFQAELTPVAPPEVERGIHWVFIGPQGLRAGWSALVWLALTIFLIACLGAASANLHLVDRNGGMTPKNMFISELTAFLALLASVVVMALIERRRILEYNLMGPRRPQHFFAGLATGFAALSTLVGALAAGGWLRVGGVALSGVAIVQYGLFWGCVFLLVGFVEEGSFRCYLQSTLTRGINFWWALGVVALICARLMVRHRGNGVWGDYALALLGLVPCFILHQRRVARNGFWQAAWVTSTLFGFVHTGNGGENWIGIFAAGAIGFIFCVSIRVTGSAWWAIGCHAGWDWGETFFYGTADSGLVAKGHFLSSTSAGNALWSGGSDGPEGSLLVIGVILLLLVWLLAVYGRRGAAELIPA